MSVSRRIIDAEYTYIPPGNQVEVREMYDDGSEYRYTLDERAALDHYNSYSRSRSPSYHLDPFQYATVRVNNNLYTYGIEPPVSKKRDIETRTDTVPVLAWKRASLKLENRKLRFNGVTAGYLAEDVAQCRNDSWGHFKEHDVPDLDCTCGFHAVASKDLLKEEYTNHRLWLHVELYGKVIRHQNGYRAEKQRVLSVEFPAGCSNQLCTREVAAVAERPSNRELIPFCEYHHDMIQDPLVAKATFAELSEMMGTTFKVSDNEQGEK